MPQTGMTWRPPEDKGQTPGPLTCYSLKEQLVFSSEAIRGLKVCLSFLPSFLCFFLAGTLRISMALPLGSPWTPAEPQIRSSLIRNLKP